MNSCFLKLDGKEKHLCVPSSLPDVPLLTAAEQEEFELVLRPRMLFPTWMSCIIWLNIRTLCGSLHRVDSDVCIWSCVCTSLWNILVIPSVFSHKHWCILHGSFSYLFACCARSFFFFSWTHIHTPFSYFLKKEPQLHPVAWRYGWSKPFCLLHRGFSNIWTKLSAFLHRPSASFFACCVLNEEK